MRRPMVERARTVIDTNSPGYEGSTSALGPRVRNG
jgi:hypothetical protein